MPRAAGGAPRRPQTPRPHQVLLLLLFLWSWHRGMLGVRLDNDIQKPVLSEVSGRFPHSHGSTTRPAHRPQPTLCDGPYPIPSHCTRVTQLRLVAETHHTVHFCILPCALGISPHPPPSLYLHPTSRPGAQNRQAKFRDSQGSSPELRACHGIRVPSSRRPSRAPC